MSWQNRSISSFAKVSAGQGAPQRSDEFGAEGRPFVRAGSLERLCDGADEDSLEKIPDSVARARRMTLYPAGTILFAKSGMSATLGRVHKLTKPCYVVNHLAAINVEAGTDAGFLAHFFRFSSPLRLINDGAYPSIRLSDISAWEVPLPPLDEQKRIAAVLDKADTLRRQRQESLQLTDKLLQSVFIDMFGSETDPKCPRVPLSKHLDFLTSGSRGWAKYYADQGDKFIRSLDVRMNEISDEEMIRVNAPNNAEAKRTRVQVGDVLLTITGSLIGRAATVTELHDGAYISQHVAILRTNGFIPEFVAWAISMPEGQRQIRSNQRGQTKPGLNFEQIQRIEIPRPSVEAERYFFQLMGVRTAILQEQRHSLVYSESLFSSLQQRAFRGELDLSRLKLEMDAESPAVTPALEDKLDTGSGDSIAWSEDYFKYRILSQALQPPFSFADIWEAVEYDMEEACYETVKDKVFAYVEEGTLEQQFDEERKEIVFRPRP